MKGIILAGGKGTRLYPVTKAINKHLLPVYNKPMIFYPLATLMLAGIRDFLIITNPEDIDGFKRLLGKGEDLGIMISYAEQYGANGIAEAITIGEKFIGDDFFTLMLGDNILYGSALGANIRKGIETTAPDTACVFAYPVADPERYGIVELDASGNPVSLEEKPERPKSNWAVPGLYIYGPKAIGLTKTLKPSKRGELEITDLNQIYLKNEKLQVMALGRGYAWLDMGTVDSLLDTSEFVRTIEKRQGLPVCDPYEVAANHGWIKAAS
ncbi:MAG TPA: glucose-1-phosphate thymidylyltransferase RfbA [Alphaproteobacteria bacterium]